MREIKFRGQKLHTGELCYGHFCGFVNDGTVALIGNPETNGHTGWHVNPDTVGQYTGLKDKNGKEIYEGDIVHAKSWGQKRSWNSKHNTTDRLVAFHNGAFRLCCGGTHYPGGWEIDSGNKFEVIGNIYQNPELLKV